MRNSILVLLVGLAVNAVALPGAGTANLAQTEESGEIVTIRIDEATGVAEMEQDGVWSRLDAIELPTEEARVEKAYYPYGAPCATRVYVDPCAAEAIPPCVNCVPPPLPEPCVAANPCAPVYVDPYYSRGYVAPYDNYPNYQEEQLPPPVQQVRPYRTYRRGGARVYQYRRPGPAVRGYTYRRYPRRR